MATNRNIDPDYCHAWLHQKGRQCRIKKPRDVRESGTRWYCHEHEKLRTRAALWVKHKRKRAPRWVKCLLALIVVVAWGACQFGPDVVGYFWGHEGEKQTNEKLDRILAYHTDEEVFAYMEDEYPLGFVLYKMEGDKVTPTVNNLGDKAEITLRDPYVIAKGGRFSINAGILLIDNPVAFSNVALWVAGEQNLRYGAIWGNGYGVVTELVKIEDETTYVCMALSSDRRLFFGNVEELVFMQHVCFIGTPAAHEDDCLVVLRGELANVGETELLVSDFSLVAEVEKQTFPFISATIEAPRLIGPDGRTFTIDPTRNLAQEACLLKPGEKKAGHFAFATRSINSQRLNASVQKEGVAVHLLCRDTRLRRLMKSVDFQISSKTETQVMQ